MTSWNIFVLIPAHNEQAHITQVVSCAKKYLPVLVVDDGSTDDTVILAKAAGAKIIRQSPNQGKGAALLTGFRYALRAGAKAVITLDGDGQHDPEEIPKFLSAYRDYPTGLLIGKRDFSQMPFIRRLANTLGRISFSGAVGQNIHDNQSGYRLVDKAVIELLLENKERGFEFEVEMVVLALKHDLGIGWVPIRTIYAGEKSHIKPLHHLINFLRVTFKAWQAVHKKRVISLSISSFPDSHFQIKSFYETGAVIFFPVSHISTPTRIAHSGSYCRIDSLFNFFINTGKPT